MTTPDVLVAGLANLETNVPVGHFPIPYEKSRFLFDGIRDNPGGVGLNVAAAMTRLGHSTALLAMVGRDAVSDLLCGEIRRRGIDDRAVVQALERLPRSLILVDEDARAAMFTDLRQLQDTEYPIAHLEELACAATTPRLLHATNINFALPLAHRARALGITVSTDVQSISVLDDTYNRRFLAVANIVFFSAERLECDPAEAIRTLWERHGTDIVVVGMGARGAMLGERSTGAITMQAAPSLRPVVNAVGAGDALASGFLSSWLRGFDPVESLRRAQHLASWKVGSHGATEGLLDGAGLDELMARRRS